MAHKSEHHDHAHQQGFAKGTSTAITTFACALRHNTARLKRGQDHR